MRIGLVVERFDPLRGGLEQWTYRFARELLARGHEVHVVSREFAGRAASLPITRHRVVCRARPLAFAEAAQLALTSLTLDIVHDMGVGWYCDVFQPHGGSWASVARRKLQLWPACLRGLKQRLDHLLPRHREFHRLMARQYADAGQTLLAISRSVADDFQQFHHAAPERIRVVYNGVDTEQFSPERCAAWRDSVRRQLGIGADTIVVLQVAQNFQLKGVPTALRAAARLVAQGRPVHLVIVGGRQLSHWRHRAARLGLSKAVSFVGSTTEPLLYYAAADLYVHPTFYDTCSLVVLEAAACGLPIVTSRCNGAAELLADGVEARLLNSPADAEELAEGIRLLLDEPLRRRMGAAARRNSLGRTFARNVDEILALYREIVDRRGGLPRGYRIWTARIPASVAPAAAAAPTRLVQPLREPGVVP
jgi:UDP-glucose:(heptosyl)LPS alpha-1,3-glucosyltransferase